MCTLRLSHPPQTLLVQVTSPLPFSKIISFESPIAEEKAESQRGEVTGSPQVQRHTVSQ